MANLMQKLAAGVPYFAKEVRIMVSDRTPLMIARPRSINILPSKRCNAFCPMCPIGEANLKGEKPDPTELTAGQVSDLFDGIKDLSGKGVVVSFADGEPTVWKPLWEMLARGRDLGFAISFTTNGYTMKETQATRVAVINPFNVGVSLESLRGEINEIMRPLQGKGTQKTIDCIENLLAAREKAGATMSLNIKTVLAGVNYAHVHEIVERFAARPGVMWTPQPYRGTDERMWIRDTDHFRQVIEHLVDLKARGHKINASDRNLRDFVTYFEAGMERVDNAPNRSGEETLDAPRCQIGFTSLFVTQDAEVRLCPYMGPVGRIGDGQTLRQMWTGKAAQERRAEIAACKVDCELSCTRRTSIAEKVKLFLQR